MFSQPSEEVDESDLYVSPLWKDFNIYDENQEKAIQNEKPTIFIDDKAMRMMQRMGYKTGSGLGKNEQGITAAVDVPCHLGKRGLGLEIKGISSSTDIWDFSKEEIHIPEQITWLENNIPDDTIFSLTNLSDWIQEGATKYEIENECDFCDKAILDGVLKAKNIFDELGLQELCNARTRANPFETIKSVFFMNRAALKMANIDAVTNFMFSNIDKDGYHTSGPHYFADVCAGPGGFSEYILWRKGWHFKGFGLTLRDENDFKLYDSTCATPATFQALYGKRENGDVCCPENIDDFSEKVLHETDGKGVHFMMSDGGFSVEGNENIQEILSKNIYICQCLVALEIVRSHGHFVTKIFDVFTPFSVGLLYLMHKCFEKVTILKPNSSRPANSERYFICSNLRKHATIQSIKQYLRMVVERLWQLRDNSEKDILEIVPMEIIKADFRFHSYIVDSNNNLGKRQTVGLEKLAAFCRNPNLVELRQEELRKKCLNFWKIPNLPKIPRLQFTADELVKLLISKPEILLVRPKELDELEDLSLTFSDLGDWHYCNMYGTRKQNNCSFYAGVSTSKVYRFQKGKWAKIKNLQLVKGTVVYGELVKEWSVLKKDPSVNTNTETYKYSLHIIDALRLGDKNLSDLKFKERAELLQLYCKAVNKEFSPNTVRIRPKVMSPLLNLSTRPLLKEDKQTGSYIAPLPVIGYGTFSEVFHVNSLLLLKTNENQSFHSTFVLRVQIFINSKGEEYEDKCLTLKDTIAQLKQGMPF